MNYFSDALQQHERLQQRFRHSEEFITEVRQAINTLRCGNTPEICVFAAGSLGRFETGRKSDLDVFFLANCRPAMSGKRALSHLQEIEIFADLIRLNENLKLEPFSGDGRFLKVHEVDDLISATGDSTRDDNENLFTARLLLLLESKYLSNAALYSDALRRVLDHYFRDGKGRRDFRPLFLLNDVLRYWRTLCLNYERDRTLEKPWWKKNFNLKFSRKLAVYSTVLALVAEQIVSTDDFVEFAADVPWQRLARTLDRLGDQSLQDSFVKALDDYEYFLAAKSFGELATKDPEKIEGLRLKAESFGDLFFRALNSTKLDRSLVRYVLI